MAADADSLKGFRPSSPPRIPGREVAFYQEEFKKLQSSIESLIVVIGLLEARIEALEP